MTLTSGYVFFLLISKVVLMMLYVPLDEIYQKVLLLLRNIFVVRKISRTLAYTVEQQLKNIITYF